MSNDTEIRERLRKIKALFDGATCDGERQAAGLAMHRIANSLQRAREAAGAAPEPEIEFRFSLTNSWSLRLFIALCRAKGLKPYRYPRMRRTPVNVRITRTRLDHEFWPEFNQMNEVLTQHLSELADTIIADCIDSDRTEAEVIVEPLGLAAPAADARQA